MWLLYGLVIFIVSATIAKIMVSLGITDRLTTRSLHTCPTPRAGGVAIVVAYSLGIAVLYRHEPEIFGIYSNGQLCTIAVAIAAIVVTSLYDDIRPISYTYRLIVQIVCAAAIAQSGLGLSKLWLPYVGYIQLGAFKTLFTILWIVSFINIFNFMDGVDGLVGGCSILACAFLAIIAQGNGASLMQYSLAILALSIAGFLTFNFPKAKIFMGDVGSHSLGFLFALHEINMDAIHAYVTPADNFIPCLTAIIIVGNFVFDVVFTLARRLASGKSIVLPHNEFLFHILYKNNWSHIKISLLHFGFVVFQGGLACISKSKTSMALSALVVLVVQATYACIVLHMKKTADAK
ncbi:MAG: undecaprenyl/decaprenyl-phosphate alpha-N-acetylglucosaminyl 1-phosphate transferase [Holosporales bacterium]|jgi:UDP-GlcNAc:undecaprenyl-phosphate GlcNAc-1-phosphate transferase|nr:undecaprenyl/decaprenyl-phosphate alpha-N-acetylglucosaminyl 1-phosphate transferase [Holosporales bacterium]